MARFHKSRTNQLRASAGVSRSASFDAVLSLPLSVTNRGKRTIRAADEVFLLDLRVKSRSGKDPAASELLADYTDFSADLVETNERPIAAVNHVIVTPGSVNRPLELLRMAKKFDRYRKEAYMSLEPWLVQEALDRLGGRQLSLQEQ